MATETGFGHGQQLWLQLQQRIRRCAVRTAGQWRWNFSAQRGYQLTDLNNAVGVAAGDVNGDGKLDLVAVDYCASRTCNGDGSLLSILLGNGDGTFQAPTNVPTDNYPSAAALADINGDGKLDMVVAVGGLVIAGATRGPLDFRGFSNPGYVAFCWATAMARLEKGVELTPGRSPQRLPLGTSTAMENWMLPRRTWATLAPLQGRRRFFWAMEMETLQGHIDYPGGVRAPGARR